MEKFFDTVSQSKLPSTERYARWCGKTVNEIISYLLPDKGKIKINIKCEKYTKMYCEIR